MKRGRVRQKDRQTIGTGGMKRVRGSKRDWKKGDEGRRSESE